MYATGVSISDGISNDWREGENICNHLLFAITNFKPLRFCSSTQANYTPLTPIANFRTFN